MNRKRFFHIINGVLGLYMLWFGTWLMYSGLAGFYLRYTADRASSLPLGGQPVLLWCTMIIDYACSILFGVIIIYAFTRLTPGKFIIRVACLNFLRYFVIDILMYISHGMLMMLVNYKRVLFPSILLIGGIWWYYYRKNHDMKGPKWFPYVWELKRVWSGQKTVF